MEMNVALRTGGGDGGIEQNDHEVLLVPQTELGDSALTPLNRGPAVASSPCERGIISSLVTRQDAL